MGRSLFSLKVAAGALLAAVSMLTAEIAVPADPNKPPALSCKPGHRQVAAYSASGRCRTLGPNTYPTTDAAGLGDEPIVSIEVGPGATAAVCGIDENFALECEASSFSKKNNRPSHPWTFLQVATSSFDVDCRPKEAEITISSGDSFSRGLGPCVRLGPGKYENAKSLGLVSAVVPPFQSDREKLLRDLRKQGTLLLKSRNTRVRAGREVQAMTCAGEGLKGECRNLAPGARVEADLGSIYVRKYCRPESNQVGVFEVQGGFGACIIRDIGEYLTAKSISVEGVLGSSLLLGSDVQARTCTQENLRGDCVDVKGPGIVDRPVGSLVVRTAQPPAQ